MLGRLALLRISVVADPYRPGLILKDVVAEWAFKRQNIDRLLKKKKRSGGSP
jgi:hypothetical protein